MSRLDKTYDIIRQFTFSLASWQQAYFFIKEHKPWIGLREYGWLIRVAIIGAIIFGLQFCKNLFSWISTIGTTTQQLGLTSTMSSFYNDVALKNFEWILSGGSKYLVLILLEVLVFHFTRFTLAFLTGQDSDSSFNAFVKAEIRMIKVAIRCWVLETICIFLLGLGLGIIDFESWKGFLSLFIKFYFVGYAMIDNYFECFGATVKESSMKIAEMAGATIGIGMVVYGLMYIPFVGVVLSTTIGAVAATITVYNLVPPEKLQFEAQMV